MIAPSRLSGTGHGGRRLIISNDSDFGLGGSSGNTSRYGLVAKTLPDGRQDFDEFLVIDRV